MGADFTLPLSRGDVSSKRGGSAEVKCRRLDEGRDENTDPVVGRHSYS